ncbi:MAG TPA: ABC transporter permease [Candidatus Acidoferrum sp.]|nr:ABC transporter permease [Candidatus Acidoferrum sp.]
MLAYLKSIVSRFRAQSSPQNVDREFQHELDTHLEMATQENIRRGMTAADAARAARIRLGGDTQLKETNRELRGLPFIETALQDFRFAFRMLRKNPGFSAIAILTLALGIGANTAIFSVVYAVLLKPLPYTNSEQLFTVFQQGTKDAKNKNGFSFANMRDFRAQSDVFVSLSGVQAHQLTLTGHGDPFVIDTSVVTADLFTTFQVQPILGRAFVPEDGKPGAAPVVILSENLWRGSFGSDANIVGNSITLDKRAFTVIGVMPSYFRFPQVQQSRQIWIPIVDDPLFGSWMERRGGHWLRLTGRVKLGVTLDQAHAQFDAIADRLAKQYPEDNDGWTVRMIPLRDFLVGELKTPLLVLLGAVGLVLLIACANIANLLLARATSRSREIAVRATLGAGRSRLVRQLLSETLVLSIIGGLAGVALAYYGVHVLTAFLPPELPQINSIHIDYAVLGFALALSVFASCAVGLVPAFLVAGSDLQSTLREGGRSGESSTSRRARNVLASAEIALALVLLVAAGLLLRSFSKLTEVSPGFQVEHMVKAEVALPRAQYATPQQWFAFSDNLLSRLQSQPGMRNSTIAIPLPLADGFINIAFDIENRPAPSAAAARTADYVAVSPNYFHVMNIPLVAGRTFEARDNMSAPAVAVVTRSFVRAYFPNENPIGKRIVFGFPPDPGVPREIIGVVGDVHDVSLGNDPGPMMYAAYTQSPFPGACIAVQSTLASSAVIASIRDAVASIDKDLPVTDIATMNEVIRESTAQPRFRTTLIALFAAIALILAATGIFGVISYSVQCRTNEIGIRVAMGASARTILKMVLRETMLLALVGLAVGLPVAFASSHVLGHLLFGVSPTDPATLIAVSLTLAAVAVAAGYLPARRATQVDPLIALRHD